MRKFYEVRAGHAEETVPENSRVKSLRSHNLRVDMFDVGPGEAVLVRAPGRESIFVDCGTDRYTTAAADAVATKIGKKRLKAFVASHPHEDHLNFVSQISERHRDVLANDFKFYDNGAEALSKSGEEEGWWAKLKGALGAAGIGRETVTEVVRPNLLGNEVTVALYAGWYKPSDYQSVFMHVTFGLARLLFTGDAYCKYENRLLDKYASEDVFSAHVLKVTHHGGQDGTGKRFVAAVRPGIALASTYDDKGHRWENVARDRLPEKCEKFETWTKGDVTISTDGKPIGGGVLFEVKTRLPGRLEGLLKLRKTRQPYDGTAQTSKSQRTACEETA